MKCLVAIFLVAMWVMEATGQSGRRPPPPPSPSPTPSAVRQPQTETANRKQVVNAPRFRCLENGNFVSLTDDLASSEKAFSAKDVDYKAMIVRRPRPNYPREARLNRVQGYVLLRMVLRASAQVGAITVIRGLPFGLTESALRAACRIEFRPASKNNKPVDQFLMVEYAFRRN